MNEDQMRTFILLAKALGNDGPDEAPLLESVQPEPSHSLSPVLLHDLNDIVFRLRGFLETSGGDYALGVETGMQRAADMIENLIRRYGQGDDNVG